MSSDLAELADLAGLEGYAVLNEVDAFLSRFISYPNDSARHAHTLWLAHTWRMDVWDSTPRLAFMSPEKGSGKTRALEVSQYLVPNGVRVAQASTAYVLARVSQQPPPTLLYDEIDTVYGRNAKGNEELRAVLNAGHRRGATAGRGSWDNGVLTPRDYPAYCAVALAGIGDLPDTIADRSVVIRMKRRKPGERIDPWRDRFHAEAARGLGEKLGTWMADGQFFWPEGMPVHDRAADVWEPLIMVADAAEDHWPSTARAAAKVMASPDPSASRGIQLLRDLRTVFAGKDKLCTEDLLRGLIGLPESPWGRYHHGGAALDSRDLASLLRDFDVRSKDLWIKDRSIKGYTADDLADAWDRYLPPV